MTFVLALVLAQEAYRPTECLTNQCFVDPADCKVGRWVTYLFEAGETKYTQTFRIVGKSGDDWLIEHWMDMPSLAYGYLFRLSPEKKLTKAWSAAKGDRVWSPIPVRAAPPVPPNPIKPEVKVSEDRKEVKAGTFECSRLDVTVNVAGKDYKSTTWYSKRVWKFFSSTEHGGMLAMEATGTKMSLDGMGDKATPTIPLPKE